MSDNRNCNVVETSTFSNGSIMVSCWRDKKIVNIISSVHTDCLPKDTGKTTWDGSVQRKPQPVMDYNKTMEGVDKAEQVLQYYNPCRKSMKWYKKFFFHILNVSNHIISKEVGHVL